MVVQASAALATNRYVATTGSDTNTGLDAAHPYLTITKADTVAAAGDVINVAPGNYTFTGGGNFTTNATGTAGNTIKFISTARWGAKIVPRSTDTISWVMNGAYSEVIGFDVAGPTGTSSQIGIESLKGNTAIRNNHVHDVGANVAACGSPGGAGVDAFGQATVTFTDAYTVDGNLINNVGPTAFPQCQFWAGIYLAQPNSFITNNIIYNFGYEAIVTWHDSDNSVIANNTMFATDTSANTKSIIVGTGDWYLRTTPGNNYKIVNNIVVGTYGIMEETDSVTVTYVSAHPSFVWSNTYTNNTEFGSGACSPISNCTNTAASFVTGVVTTDPKFVNYQVNGTGDYHLQATSPAIGTGTASFAPSTDFDSNPRPSGSGFDRGAYEFTIVQPPSACGP